MTARQVLDNVVRQVEPDVTVDPSCQVLVPIDLRTGEPVAPGFFSSLGKKHHRYFLVTNSHQSGALAVRRELKITIDDFASDWRLDLLVDYEARCTPGKEVRVAQALASGASPQERLESLLRQWVLKKVEGQAAGFVSNFDRASRSLAEELRTRALELTGLTLAVRMSLAESDRLDPLAVGPLTLPVRLRDRDEKIDLHLEVELIVERGKEKAAYLHRDRHSLLDKAVQKKTVEYFAAEVSLQEFHTSLDGRIREGLKQQLDELAAPDGRKVSRLTLRGEAFPGVIEEKKVEHTFSHPLSGDFPEPVEVKTDLLLQLVDLGRYVRAKAPDLEIWANGEVEKAAIRSLFDVSYSELCSHYDEKKAAIEREMKERAAAIGYELKQLTTITNLQLDVLRRPFPIHLAGEFTTNQARLKVRLEVNATLKVPNPSRIAALLDRRIDVREQIQSTLLDRIRQSLHAVSPEHFYMEFETAKDGRLPVREQLGALIEKTVREEFCAEIINLSCKQLDTELSLRLERLMSMLHEIAVKVVSSRGGPEVVFDGSFRVIGVDENGWVSFQTSAPEPDKLRDCAIRHLQYLLADDALGLLLQTSNAEQLQRIDRWVRERIKDEFGLTVRVMDWLRRPLEEEQQVAKARLSLVTDTVHEQETRIELAREMRERSKDQQLEAFNTRWEQLPKLQESLLRAQLSGDQPEKVQVLQETIARLQQEHDAVLAKAASDRSTAILPSLHSARAILTEGSESAAQSSPAEEKAKLGASDGGPAQGA